MSHKAISIRELRDRWNGFFFESAAPETSVYVRIGYSLVLSIVLLIQLPYVATWYSDNGVLPFDASRAVIDSDTLTLFSWIPNESPVVGACYLVLMVQTVLLLIGLRPRFQAACIFIWLISFHHRNHMISDGADTVLRIYAFLLALSPCGCRLSVDNWWYQRRYKSPLPTPMEKGWAIRLMQIQLTVIYLAAVLHKLNSSAWLDGTALYYVSRLDDSFGRLPVPEMMFQNIATIKIMTWSVLVAECALVMGLWFRETRLAAVLLGMMFHLALDWSMNLFCFEWIMMVALLSFVTPKDIRRLRKLPTLLVNSAMTSPSV